jgi:hypothetical protein
LRERVITVAYIRKHKDQWRAQVEKNGQRASKLFTNRQEAQHWAVRKELEFAATRGEDKGKTFQAAVDLYLRTVSVRKKDAVEREARRFAAFAAFFGDTTPLNKITPARVGEWRDKELKRVTGATLNRYANLLRNLFTVARDEWEWIDRNPFTGVWLPEEDEGVRMDYIWRWREIRKILRHCQRSDGIKTQEVGRAFHIALRTGLRLSEILIAKLDGDIITISNSKTTRKGKVIKIPTTRHGRRVMQKYAGTRYSAGANEASTLFHEACIDCGLRQKGVDGLTFHDSRATALTSMSKRMTVQTLQKISRHRNINILVNTYYRESAEEIAARL